MRKTKWVQSNPCPFPTPFPSSKLVIFSRIVPPPPPQLNVFTAFPSATLEARGFSPSRTKLPNPPLLFSAHILCLLAAYPKCKMATFVHPPLVSNIWIRSNPTCNNNSHLPQISNSIFPNFWLFLPSKHLRRLKLQKQLKCKKAAQGQAGQKSSADEENCGHANCWGWPSPQRNTFCLAKLEDANL